MPFVQNLHVHTYSAPLLITGNDGRAHFTLIKEFFFAILRGEIHAHTNAVPTSIMYVLHSRFTMLPRRSINYRVCELNDICTYIWAYIL